MASGAVDAAAEGVAALGISAGGGGQWAEPLRRNLRLLSHDQVTNSAAISLLLLLAAYILLVPSYAFPFVPNSALSSSFSGTAKISVLVCVIILLRTAVLVNS
jgi:hypothetical protein